MEHATQTSADSLWDAIAGRLRETLSETTYDTWFAHAEPRSLGDPRGDADRPVGAGRDHAVDPERRDEALDRGLVLGREDAPAVGEPESGRSGVAIDDRDPEVAGAGRLEQPELSGACA